MNKLNAKAGLLIIMILLAALSRLMPHPYNFSPLVAMALFGGALFDKKWLALIVPIAAYFISDIALQASGKMGIYSFSQPFVIISQAFVYAGMILITLLGTTLHHPKAVKVLGYSLTGSAIFWIVSNFGVWVGNYFAAGTLTYEPGLTLGMTYLRALPFYNTMGTEMFVNAFLGDLFYCAVLFGVFALVQKRNPALQYSK
ncbi:MAG TPA: hypothetical protein PKE30_17055 [Niabella sp.]|mgnify:CR=1 FL=1|nr:hypothetical protein [Niabella sp.]